MNIVNFFQENPCYFRKVFQKSHIGIVLIDEKSRVIDINLELLSILKFEKNFLINRDFSNIVDSLYKEKFKESIQKLLNRESNSLNMEIATISSNTQKIYFDLHLSSITEDKKVEYIALFLENITEKKIMQLELEKRDRVLIQQSKMALMGEMIDVIAHQWKQPLNIISLQLMDALFDEDISYNEFTKLSENIQLQISHMNSTIDEFRAFFKPTKSSEFFDIKEAVSEAMELIKREIRKYRIKIELSMLKDAKIVGIKSQFIHMILNLINNSKDEFLLKEINSPKISIELKDKIEFFILEIEDNAKGIDETIIGKIFEINYTTKKEGSGIGLYITKMIVEQLSGEISVRNSSNGAIFKIKLPKIRGGKNVKFSNSARS